MQRKNRYKSLSSLSDKEKMLLVERMIEACIQYVDGKITFNQLWHRCRGPRLNIAIQKIKDDRLSYLLLQLYLDFMTWKDENNKLIRKSAFMIADWATTKPSLPL